MRQLVRLRALRTAALWHAFGSEPGSPARQTRDRRARRVRDAYHAELGRLESARVRRLAAYLKRSGRAA